MLKKCVFRGLICLLTLIICYNMYEGHKIKYPAGIDTVESYGDGTFQILSGTYEGIYYEGLNQEKYNSCIIHRVEHRCAIGTNVYIMGSNNDGYVYAILELSNNTMRFCGIPNDHSDSDVYITHMDEMLENNDIIIVPNYFAFSEEERTIFAKMKNVGQ